MKTLVRAISDPSAISEIGAELDDFIVTNTKNPFMLATFLKGRMEWALTQAMNPVVLVFFVDKKIRGVVPLLFKKKYGIRLANFLFTYEFSTDFIFENQYKEAFIRFTLHFIFKRSQLVYLILPLESSNLNILTQMCEINGVTCRRNAELPIHHRILPVDCSWGAFLKSKSGSSRRKFNSITKKIENNGDWTVSCAENGANEQGVFEQIMAVEESCWKQNWRMQNHMFKVDDVLFNLWFFSGALSKINPDFKRSVWLLYFKGNITAYSLVFQIGRAHV
jgi:CelD/BcsL family acetyltransferase involved in cellulose biosynthesis